MPPGGYAQHPGAFYGTSPSGPQHGPHIFIREMVENMQVPYVNTVDNLADFFTKPLPARVFVPMRDAIMNSPASWREDVES